jgi:hypothetical protein
VSQAQKKRTREITGLMSFSITGGGRRCPTEVDAGPLVVSLKSPSIEVICIERTSSQVTVSLKDMFRRRQ